MMKAVMPGSFDPISKGHLAIIERASKIFDEVHVLVSNNNTKNCDFTASERVSMIETVTKHLNNVVVASSEELVVKYAKKNDISVILRGIRNINDYETELRLAQYNKDINDDIETLIMFPSSKYSFISSSAIKEFIGYGVNINKYVPEPLIKIIEKRYKKYKKENK